MIPIGTDVRTRKLPVANVAIVAANVVVFLFTDVFGGTLGQVLKMQNTLDAARPLLHQYITYQFLHGDLWHLVGNMIFLWVFGNAVCDKMGGVCYTLFYLAGGVTAGVVFTLHASSPILGASGAIAAVTTAFLALFPRSRVHILLIFVFITTFELPSVAVIVFKIILWDNVIAPSLDRNVGTANVAYSAHLGGYAFGFLVSMLLMLTRALPRNQFDLPALWNRQRRRASFARQVSFQPARPISVQELDSRPIDQIPTSPIERLRSEVLDRVADRDLHEAARLYLRLLELDPTQVLPRQAQLDVANQLAQMQLHDQAVRAYEGFLQAYPTSKDVDQVRLLLGLICNRYLGLFEKAAAHLRRALDGLTQDSQRALASDELKFAEAQLYGPPGPG